MLAVMIPVILGVGCSQTAPPVVEEVRTADDRVPIVFVPGVTGVGLRERTTGKAVWGLGHNLLKPHDRGHAIARPLVKGYGGPDLLPDDVILQLRLLRVLRLNVYQQLLDLFLANGYEHGDLEHPRPRDDLFLFSYDWRQDNVESAIRLAGQLDRLRQARGEQQLRVNLICQSNGAHVCRYFTKFGAASLESAESGERQDAGTIVVDRLVLVGSSNGGSIRILREMNRVRKFIKGIGRFWSPETLFTYQSLFQDLPAYTSDLFVDKEGQSLAVDLYAAENWQKFGWSIYGAGSHRYLQTSSAVPWLGNEVERRELLQDFLDRARRFQRVLRQDVEGFGPTRYYLIMNSRRETSSRAVLVDGEGTWQTLFEDDKQVRSNPALREAVITMGDGHATNESQSWLSEQELGRIEVAPIDVDGTHRRVVLQPSTHQALLAILNGDFDSQR